MLAIQATSICHAGRQGFESPRSTYIFAPQSRPKQSRFMPTAAKLLEYSLESGHGAYARDTDCSICQERVVEPVITPCQHFYCSECIYEWLKRSTKCPDCRHDLRQTRSSSPRTFATIIASKPALAGYPSNSRLRERIRSPRITDTRRYQKQVSPDPHELAERLKVLDRGSVQEVSRRISDENSNTATPPAIRKPARSWCVQRHTPLRNRAAHPVIYYGLSEDAQGAARGLPVSQTTPHVEASFVDSKHCHDGRTITINAEEMLSRMWQTSNTLADTMEIPIRCKAIAKCVWREWRELLQSSHGRRLSADELLTALSSTFEHAVADYGWECDWRTLPRGFVEVMRMTARAAVE